MPCAGDETGFLQYALGKIVNPVLIDIGFNVGDFTALFLSYFPDASVVGFEPIPDMCEMAKKRFENNPKITIHNYGLHNTTCELPFYYVLNSHGMSSIHNRPRFFPTFDTQEIRCKFQLLDDQPIQKADYVKIDTEGNELFVLQGGIKFLTRLKPRFLQFEVGGCWYDSQTKWVDAVRILHPLYRVYYPYPNEITPETCPETPWEHGDVINVWNVLAELRS